MHTSKRGYSTLQDSALWDQDKLPISLLDKNRAKGKEGHNLEAKKASNKSVAQREDKNSPTQPSEPKRPSQPSMSRKRPSRRTREAQRRLAETPALASTASRKRRAETPMLAPSATRRRVIENDQLLTHRTLSLPKKSDYPHLRQDLLENPKSVLYNFSDKFSTLESTHSKVSPQRYRCVVNCAISAHESSAIHRSFDAVGEGSSKVG